VGSHTPKIEPLHDLAPLRKTLVQLPGGGTQEVRFFSDPSVQASIDKALAGVTERSVVLDLGKNPTGLNAAIAANLNGHWSVAAAWQRSDWGDSLGAKLKFRW
jgi:hypothetical protein